MFTHRNLVANAAQCDPFFPGAGDVVLAVSPFFHITGMAVVIIGGLSRGATLVTMPRFDLQQPACTGRPTPTAASKGADSSSRNAAARSLDSAPGNTWLDWPFRNYRPWPVPLLLKPVPGQPRSRASMVVHPDDRGHSGVIEPAGLGQGRLQQAELSGGDLDTLADALGEPASLADGIPVLLTLAAHPAERRAPRGLAQGGICAARPRPRP